MDLDRFIPGRRFEADLVLAVAACAALLSLVAVVGLTRRAWKDGTLRSRSAAGLALLAVLGAALAAGCWWRFPGFPADEDGEEPAWPRPGFEPYAAHIAPGRPRSP